MHIWQVQRCRILIESEYLELLLRKYQSEHESRVLFPETKTANRAALYETTLFSVWLVVES